MTFKAKLYEIEDELGNIKYKLVTTTTYKTAEELSSAIKENKKKAKEIGKFKKILFRVKAKSTGKIEYNKDVLWREFVDCAYKIVASGYWPELKKDIYLVAHALDTKYPVNKINRPSF